MANRFRKHGEAYFEFITTPEIDLTNNIAEQAIRFVVIDHHVARGHLVPPAKLPLSLGVEWVSQGMYLGKGDAPVRAVHDVNVLLGLHLDRRFIREGFIKPLDRDAILLYLFLVAVSDAHGLSFYSDPSLGKLLKLTSNALTQARTQLVSQELILYRYPLYQVLPLPHEITQTARASSTSPPTTNNGTPPSGEPLMSFREFRQLKGLKTPIGKQP